MGGAGYPTTCAIMHNDHVTFSSKLSYSINRPPHIIDPSSLKIDDKFVIPSAYGGLNIADYLWRKDIPKKALGVGTGFFVLKSGEVYEYRPRRAGNYLITRIPRCKGNVVITAEADTYTEQLYGLLIYFNGNLIRALKEHCTIAPSLPIHNYVTIALSDIDKFLNDEISELPYRRINSGDLSTGEDSVIDSQYPQYRINL
jgi:hypothetical protein